MKAQRHPPVLATVIAAAALLAACGEEDTGGLQPAVAVNAVSGSSGAGGDVGPMSAESAASSDVSTMPAFVGFTYEVGQGLPALPQNSTGYQFPPGADVDEGTVAALAEAVGVTVAPERVDDAGLMWRAGPDDGSAPSLTVYRDPQLTWSYSGAFADQPVACAAPAPPVDATRTTPLVGGDAVGGGADPCPAPQPPTGVPTAAEAEAAAGNLLEALGEDPAAFQLETYADEWSASVVAWPSLDGVRAPMSWGFGFGAEGVLQWANGSLADPVPFGPYPLVDLAEALARLSEQGSTWLMSRGVATEPATALEAIETVVPEPALVPPDASIDGAPAEPEVATVVDVRADLWWASDADGSVWLLPAYTFIDTEDRQHTVPAVAAEFLIVEETPTTTVPDVTGAPPASPLPPNVDPTVVVGLTVDEAEKALSAPGLSLRVIREDGVDLIVTDDFNETRVNVEVNDGVITAVVSLG